MSEQPIANRLFNCAACRKLRIVCSKCDRGNIYCSTCAPERRRQRRREATARYQATPRGRRKHADRQRRYRERLKLQKVTHAGSQQLYRRALLERARKLASSTSIPEMEFDSKHRNCCYCGGSPTRFLRFDTLQAYTSGTNRPFRVRSNTP
jgi:hypothetical protein